MNTAGLGSTTWSHGSHTVSASPTPVTSAWSHSQLEPNGTVSADTTTSLKSYAMQLLKRAKAAETIERRDDLINLAQALVDAVANAKDADKAALRAKTAAKEAETYLKLTRSHVEECGRLVRNLVEE